MTVLATLRGNVSDWNAMKGAIDWYASQPRPAGLHWSRTYRKEGDDKYILLIEEWDDHDSFHKSSDAMGDEFTERAKQDWDGWVTEVWTSSDAPHIQSDGTRGATLVWMTVRPRDLKKFKDTIGWFAEQVKADKPKGLHSSHLFIREGDEGLVLDLEEWDSHDDWHAVTEKYGDEFNKRGDTEGLDWETFIWHPSDAKVID
jgi:quinol monooxygenase YgiN